MQAPTIIQMPHPPNDRTRELARLTKRLQAGIERRNHLVRELNAEGWSLRELAHLTGLSHITIRNIVTRGES